jgi:hypothetical protein
MHRTKGNIPVDDRSSTSVTRFQEIVSSIPAIAQIMVKVINIPPISVHFLSALESKPNENVGTRQAIPLGFIPWRRLLHPVPLRYAETLL